MKKIFTMQTLIVFALVGVAMALDHFLFGAVGGGVYVAMAALAGDRNTPDREGEFFSYPVKQAKKIYNGAMVCLNAGYAQPGATAVGLIPVGVSQELADNSAGNDGDMNVKVREGIFRFNNSAAGDAITLAEVGSTCFIVDDQTVAKTNGGGTRSIAGSIVFVDSEGVWVDIKNNAHATTGIVAANNLSDVASASTARANIGANKVVLEVNVADLVAADAKVYRVVSPVAGKVKKIFSVLEAHALAAGDATLTGKIGAAAITDGVVTITQAGSAIGDVDSATPSAANDVVEGDVISFTVGGANTDATATAKVSILIET